jgi:hypothetical protein
VPVDVAGAGAARWAAAARGRGSCFVDLAGWCSASNAASAPGASETSPFEGLVWYPVDDGTCDEPLTVGVVTLGCGDVMCVTGGSVLVVSAEGAFRRAYRVPTPVAARRRRRRRATIGTVGNRRVVARHVRTGGDPIASWLAAAWG